MKITYPKTLTPDDDYLWRRVACHEGWKKVQRKDD